MEASQGHCARQHRRSGLALGPMQVRVGCSLIKPGCATELLYTDDDPAISDSQLSPNLAHCGLVLLRQVAYFSPG